MFHIPMQLISIYYLVHNRTKDGLMLSRPFVSVENRKSLWDILGAAILSCCPRALGEGGYCWRHDQVLRAVAESISAGISLSRQQHPAEHSIAFVRAGEKSQHRTSPAGELLATARDWQLKVDLGRQLKFPDTIAVTTLRPDMVLVSETTKQVVMLELTVPWEDRMEKAFEKKRAKYEELANEY